MDPVTFGGSIAPVNKPFKLDTEFIKKKEEEVRKILEQSIFRPTWNPHTEEDVPPEPWNPQRRHLRKTRKAPKK